MDVLIEIMTTDPKMIVDLVERYQMVVNPALIGTESTTWSVDIDYDIAVNDDWEDADSIVKSIAVSDSGKVTLMVELGKRVPATFVGNVLWWVVGDQRETVKGLKIQGKEVEVNERSIKTAIESYQPSTWK